MRLALILLAAFALSTGADARIHRSTTVRHAFVKEQACPSTERHRLPCPGWIIDHVVALCVGGSDSVENLRWMTVEAAKSKDRWECRPGWEEKLRDLERSEPFLQILPQNGYLRIIGSYEISLEPHHAEQKRSDCWYFGRNRIAQFYRRDGEV